MVPDAWVSITYLVLRYKYSVCFFKEAKQDYVSLGNWEGELLT